MSASLSRLVEQAQQSARAGQVDAAERLWREVLALEPRHTQALTSLGNYALDRGDAARALEHLEAARLTAPTDLHVLMDLSGARANAGDAQGELEAIQWALAVDPEFPTALLLKGRWHERHGDATSAYDAYLLALGNAPAESLWPIQYRRDLAHAESFVTNHAKALHAHLEKKLEDALSQMDATEAGRWQEAASIGSGLSVPFTSTGHRLHVPRLPAVPFFERNWFSRLHDIEAGAAAIRDELLWLLDSGDDGFEPRIAIRPGEAVGPWQQLNHSTRWSALHLWKDGVAVKENLRRCPETYRLLEDAELCKLSGLCPNAYFSVLAAGTHIPPHTGDTNARVIAHLPLIVPDHCSLRVGFEVREWQESEVLIFDDTIEHEAFNSGDAPLAILVFDLWNPMLRQADRAIADAFAEAMQSFEGESAVASDIS